MLAAVMNYLLSLLTINEKNTRTNKTLNQNIGNQNLSQSVQFFS